MSTAKKKLTTCAPKTAVSYARYSSAGQRDVSIDQQLRDIHAFAEREGYVIIHDYADHAKSGFKNIERREQFHAMLAAAESGTFDTVIAWKVDRFGRNRRESASYKGQLLRIQSADFMTMPSNVWQTARSALDMTKARTAAL